VRAPAWLDGLRWPLGRCSPSWACAGAATGAAVTLDVRGGVASLGYSIVAPDIESAHQNTDAGIAIAVNVMRQLCGSSWSPDRVFLTRPPPRDAALFTRFFGAPVESGAPAARIRIEFSAVMLGWRVAGQSAEHRKILAPLLDKALAEAKDDFVSAVKAVPIGAPRSFVPQHTLRKAEGFWIEAVGA